MCGSGTVLAEAAKMGISSTGIDSDPLAVSISRINATTVNLEKVRAIRKRIERNIGGNQGKHISLDWIDQDQETADFINFWFLPKQIKPLRAIARAIADLGKTRAGKTEIAFFQVALSRLIITKTRGASLAWDVSHSRPHRKKTDNDFCVYEGFLKSMDFLEARVGAPTIRKDAKVHPGDARDIRKPKHSGYDAIITSPPYLNAIDYMRGHRMSLVWLGHRIGDLRNIRSDSVGAEKGPDGKGQGRVDDVIGESKYDNAIARYKQDMKKLMRAFYRTLKEGGQLVLVVGDSRIRGKLVENSATIKSLAATLPGLDCVSDKTRDIPDNRRYLPVGKRAGEALDNRMKQEHILVFQKTNI